MRTGRQLKEDAKNISVIACSALAAVVATMAVVRANAPAWSPDPPAMLPAVAPAMPERFELVEYTSAANRLYGTVRTRDGDTHTGFLRWDRNEGSWNDVLDATKLDRGFTGLSGIRFGHVSRIVPLGRTQAILHLRSGQQIGMQGGSTDLGRAMRSVVISDASGSRTSVEWDDIRRVDFRAAPANARPAEGRLYGTVSTGRGLEFTGQIAWDVDEIHSTDILDGELDGREYEIPFGAIRTIQQHGPVAARVVLHTGERITLSGTNDVDRSNRGITVSDPGLGQVKIPWDYFNSVRFHGAPRPKGQSWGDFDGGQPLRGTVITTTGNAVSGEIKWDNDEYSTWELLNGKIGGVELDIEFSRIARIVKSGSGSTVVLRDGRSYDLQGSNDVDAGNRGVVVTSGEQEYLVAWDDFRELRLDG